MADALGQKQKLISLQTGGGSRVDVTLEVTVQGQVVCRAVQYNREGCQVGAPLEQDLGVCAPDVTAAFHRLLYDVHGMCLSQSTWRGVRILKYPCDLFVLQEVVWETRPDLIIETGTWDGGTAFFLAETLRALGSGRRSQVWSVDVGFRGTLTALEARAVGSGLSDYVTFILGDSGGDKVWSEIRSELAAWEDTEGEVPRVMVILDSDHAAAHVRRELERSAPLVTPGCYLVVEDTNLNGHPVCPTHGPGPWEALAEWLPEHPEFEVDRGRERYLVTANPGGWLRRKGGDDSG